MANVLYARCPPARAILRFLNNQNQQINPAQESLNVSNHVSNDADLPIDAAFGATSDDPSNFRLEVEHPLFTGASLGVQLKVGNRPALSFTLNKKDAANGRVFRGDFLRLVTDGPDNEPHIREDQTILCALGEQVHFFFTDNGGCTDVKMIGIGRPASENDNSTNQRKHDIRQLKVHVVVFCTRGSTTLDGAIDDQPVNNIRVANVGAARTAGAIRIDEEVITYTGVNLNTNEFTGCARGQQGTAAAAHAADTDVFFSTSNPVVTAEQVAEDLVRLDERFAQSTIRLLPPHPEPNMGGQGDPGVLLPGAMLAPFEPSWPLEEPNDQEEAIVQFRSTASNTVTIFYVQEIRHGVDEFLGWAYTQRYNETGDGQYQNFVLVVPTVAPFVVPHELMHILLNETHLAERAAAEPGTALFFRFASMENDVGAAKRIGPYPDAALAEVGETDTFDIRPHVEALP